MVIMVLPFVSSEIACWIRCLFSGSMLAVASSKYFLRQQERNLLQGSALIAAVTQVMKMKEIYLSKLPMDCYGDGEPQQTHQTGFGRSKKTWEKCTVTG